MNWVLIGAGAIAAIVAAGRPCLDWTERRDHLAGHVGACLLRHSVEHGWITRQRDSRAVTITPAGAARLREIFGIGVA